MGVLEAMLRPAEVDPHLKSYVDPHLWRYRSKTLCQFSSERLAMNRTWTSISRLWVLLIAKRLDENWRGVLGKGPATKFDEFSEKCHRGGGGHFQSKNLCCRFWELLTGLLDHEIAGNFRVQDMFFRQLY